MAQLLGFFDSAVTSSLAETTLGTAMAAPTAIEATKVNNRLMVMDVLR